MPSLLSRGKDEDIAKRRCVMILNVLSGRLPVTQAIEAAGISRATYYQHETKALQGMLAALTPGTTETSPTPDATKELLALRKRVAQLEERNRRLEKLVSLTSKILGKGSVTTGAGRKRKKTSKTSRASSSSSPSSSPRRVSSGATATGAPASTPTSDGEDEC